MTSRILVMMLAVFAFGFADNAHALGKKRKNKKKNEVTLVSAPLVFGTPTQSGSGCPGEAVATLSPDGSSLSLLFDDYLLEAGGSSGVRSARKTCAVKIPVRVPAGQQLVVYGADIRGMQSLPLGARSSIQVQYWLKDGKTVSSGSVQRRYGYGPKEEDFVMSQPNVQFVSGCGGDVEIALATEATLTTNYEQDDALLVLDSVDFEDKPGVRLKVQKRACASN